MSVRHVLIAALVLTVAAACGGTEEPAAEQTRAPAATAPVALEGTVNDHGTKELTGASPTLELEADDFYFEPTYVKAQDGASITVELFNEGKATHTFTVDSLQIDEELAPEARKTVTVKLQPGAVSASFRCRFHQDQGMQGAFYV